MRFLVKKKTNKEIPNNSVIITVDCASLLTIMCFNFVKDEILAMSEKLILKAGDLVPLLIENVTWTFGRPLCQEESLSPHKEEFRNIFVCNKKGLNFSDVEKEKEKIGKVFYCCVLK